MIEIKNKGNAISVFKQNYYWEDSYYLTKFIQYNSLRELYKWYFFKSSWITLNNGIFEIRQSTVANLITMEISNIKKNFLIAFKTNISASNFLLYYSYANSSSYEVKTFIQGTEKWVYATLTPNGDWSNYGETLAFSIRLNAPQSVVTTIEDIFLIVYPTETTIFDELYERNLINEKLQLNTEPLFGYAGVFDEYLGDGKVLRRWGRRQLLIDDIIWETSNFNNYRTNTYKVVLRMLNPDGLYGSSLIGIKYDGLGLNQVNGETLVDIANKISWGSTNSYFVFGIGNLDSGWISSITPNSNEIKAYFNGWKATANDGSRYTEWEAIGDNSITSTDINYVSTTKVTDVAGYSGNWKPYEIIYQLATPQIEEIQPSGELNLYPGDNYLIIPDFSVLEISGQPKYMNG